MEINEKINEIREDIAASEAALEKANGLLNSKLGHMLANFCGNPNRTKADLDAIKKEMEDSGNPYGVSIQIESERKGGEALIMEDTFYVGFKFNTSWFLFYKMDSRFDLDDDIANEMKYLEKERGKLERKLADLKELEEFGEITLDKAIEFLDTHDITDDSRIYYNDGLLGKIADFAYTNGFVDRHMDEWDRWEYCDSEKGCLFTFSGRVNGYIVANTVEDAMYTLHKKGIDYHGLQFEVIESGVAITDIGN